MPLKTILRKLVCCVPREQEEAETETMVQEEQPLLEFAADEPMEPGRPYQDFVESETRKFWQEMVNVGSLTKPAQQEIRAAAMPILCQALRRRPGRKLNPHLYMAHHAVADVVEHAREQRWAMRPLSEPHASPTYIDALIQLADDANWLAREIPLPDHPPPKHPPIYYTINPETGVPVPRADSLIRGDYVYTKQGTRLTNVRHIRPWLSNYFNPLLFLWTGRAYYSLVLTPENNMEVTLHLAVQIPNSNSIIPFHCPLRNLHFSPQPPSIPGRSGE